MRNRERSLTHRYIVICLDDDGLTYIQATSKHWQSEWDAASYAETLARGRQPVIVRVPRLLQE